MDRARGLSVECADRLAAAGDSTDHRRVPGRSLYAGDPEVFLRCPKSDSTQAGDTRDVGGSIGLGQLVVDPGSLAGADCSRADGFAGLFTLVVGQQSSEAAVNRYLKGAALSAIVATERHPRLYALLFTFSHVKYINGEWAP